MTKPKNPVPFSATKLPIITVIVVLVYWAFMKQLHVNAAVFATDNFAKNTVASQVLGTAMLSMFPLIVLGIIIDLIGGKRSLVLFFILSFGFCIIWSFLKSPVGFGLGSQLYAIAEILLVLGLYKLIAIYTSRKTFLVSIGILYALNVALVYYAPHFLMHSNLQHRLSVYGIVLGALSLMLAAISHFLLPEKKIENTQYSLEDFRDIIRPLFSFRTWGVIISLSFMILYLGDMFEFLMGAYLGPDLHFSHSQISSAYLMFIIATAVGYLAYAIVFRDSQKPNRIVAMSCLMIIICMLGVGYFSMSHILVLALIVMIGLFFGSSVLLFSGLLEKSSVAGFATACAAVMFVGAFLHLFFIRTLLVPALHASHSIHILSIVWMFGTFALVLPMLLSFISLRPLMEKKNRVYPHPTLISRILGFYRGENSLKLTFWLFFSLGQGFLLLVVAWILLVVSIPQLMMLLSSHSRFIEKGLNGDFMVSMLTIFMLVNLISTYISFLAVWRSARKSDSRFVRVLVRTLMSFALIGAVLFCLVCVAAFFHV